MRLIKHHFLLILAGLPAAGKSYFANLMKKALQSIAPAFNVKIIDPDNIRNDIFPQPFNHEDERSVRTNYLKMIKEAVAQEDIVICDDLNYYTSMRHDIKEIAEEFHIPFFIIHISTPIETCLKWNMERGSPIPNEVVQRINEKFDSFDNYSWDKPTISCDLSTANVQKTISLAITQIETKLRYLNMKKKTSEMKKLKRESKDKLELITRRIVGSFLRNQEYHHLKRRLLNLRKMYIKERMEDINSEVDFSRDFMEFLKKALNIDYI